MVGESSHFQGLPVGSFSAVALCQRDAKDEGGLLRVLHVGLVEVADTEEQQCVGMFGLEVEVLFEDGRKFFLLGWLLCFGGELAVGLLGLRVCLLQLLYLGLGFRGGGEAVDTDARPCDRTVECQQRTGVRPLDVYESFAPQRHLLQLVGELSGGVGVGLHSRQLLGVDGRMEVFGVPVFGAQRLLPFKEGVILGSSDRIAVVVYVLDVQAVFPVVERRSHETLPWRLVGSRVEGERFLYRRRLFERLCGEQPLVTALVFGGVAVAVEEQGVVVILLSLPCVIGGESHLQDFPEGFAGGVLLLFFGG